ncbi:MAG: glutamine--fructose-6-phosphate aminotransferase, partial [Leptolinea sp.]
HGPIAMLMKDFPVVALAPIDNTLDDMKAMIREVKSLDVRLVVMSNDKEVLDTSNYAIVLPKNLPGWLSPIISTIPGQLLALELATAKGLDVDHPRGLKKVTLTL